MLIKNLKNNLKVTNKLIKSKIFNDAFHDAVTLIDFSLSLGGRIYIAGNGGSASDALHLAAEFVGRYKTERNPLPAEALVADVSTLTAIGNDYGYDQVFVRQLQAKMTINDIFFAISTSGNSPNILRALEFTRSNNYKSILLTGKDGGQAYKEAFLSLIVPSNDVSVIQQHHIIIYHSLIEFIEKNL